MLVRVEVDASGEPEVLVLNAVEDLKHDYDYFIRQAKKTPANARKTMFFHQRWLRAALFFLLAYVDAEVNRFIHQMLKKRRAGFLFSRIERDPLERKLDLLHEVVRTDVERLNIKVAKEIRNLWVHSKPESEARAFERLTLDVIVQAADEFQRWVADMENALRLKRHADSKKTALVFSRALGPVIESSGSKGGYFRRREKA